MQIHIITFSRSIGVVVRAYLDYDKAKSDYENLVKDKYASGSYGLVSVPIQDSSKQQTPVDGAGECGCGECGGKQCQVRSVLGRI